MKDEFCPHRIYLDAAAEKFPMTGEILARLPSIPVEKISCLPDFLDDYRSRPDPLSHGKKSLLLTVQKGQYIKPCPCTPFYTGCNYFIINCDTHCPLDCSYCILQLYLNNPLITINVNREDMEMELDRFLALKKKPFRIGTGELGDSLAIDHITRRAERLIEYFRGKEKAVLELKTKSANIRNIISVEPHENVVIAWSLNARQVVDEEEKSAPSLENRLQAARRVCRKGYRVAFHFDPLIRFPGWREGYREAANLIFRYVPASRVAWISIGSLRYPPDLKSIIQNRFPGSRIVYEEMVRGKDGKQRYLLPHRREMFRELIKNIRAGGGEEVPLYFCMEGIEIWKDLLNIKPRDKDEVENYLTLSRG